MCGRSARLTADALMNCGRAPTMETIFIKPETRNLNLSAGEALNGQGRLKSLYGFAPLLISGGRGWSSASPCSG
jgi:hypothetical protein